MRDQPPSLPPEPLHLALSRPPPGDWRDTEWHHAVLAVYGQARPQRPPPPDEIAPPEVVTPAPRASWLVRLAAWLDELFESGRR